jgi:hypothetical protein
MVGNINKRLHNLTSTIKAIQAQRLVDPVNGDSERSTYAPTQRRPRTEARPN